MAAVAGAPQAPPTLGCFLCRGRVIFRNNDSTRFHSHLTNEHGVVFELDFLFAACGVEEEVRNKFRHMMEAEKAKKSSFVKLSKPNIKVEEKDPAEISKPTQLQVKTEPGVTSASCDKCEHVSPSSTSLGIHIRQTHKDEMRMFSCNSCDKSYPLKRQLGRHNTKVHGSVKRPLESESVKLKMSAKKKVKLEKEELGSETNLIQTMLLAQLSDNEISEDEEDGEVEVVEVVKNIDKKTLNDEIDNLMSNVPDKPEKLKLKETLDELVVENRKDTLKEEKSSKGDSKPNLLSKTGLKKNAQTKPTKIKTKSTKPKATIKPEMFKSDPEKLVEPKTEIASIEHAEVDSKLETDSKEGVKTEVEQTKVVQPDENSTKEMLEKLKTSAYFQSQRSVFFACPPADLRLYNRFGLVEGWGSRMEVVARPAGGTRAMASFLSPEGIVVRSGIGVLEYLRLQGSGQAEVVVLAERLRIREANLTNYIARFVFDF